MSDTTLNQLIIHELTKAQLPATQASNELYLVTDEIPLDSSDIDATVTSSSTDAKIPSSKCLYDNLQNKQNTLVSGTNIKTINSTSLLGSGNVTVANTDASNFSTTGKSTLSKFGMPSSRYIDLTLGASGSTYTTPANGWLQCACTGTAGSTFFELVTAGASSTASFTGGWARTSIPVSKNRVVTVYYGGTNFTKQVFRFTYAEGEQ